MASLFGCPTAGCGLPIACGKAPGGGGDDTARIRALPAAAEILFTSKRETEANKRLRLLDLEAGTETPLTDAANHAEGRGFSPDGEWVVFWRIHSGESQADIYLVRRDGSGGCG